MKTIVFGDISSVVIIYKLDSTSEKLDKKSTIKHYVNNPITKC